MSHYCQKVKINFNIKQLIQKQNVIFRNRSGYILDIYAPLVNPQKIVSLVPLKTLFTQLFYMVYIQEQMSIIVLYLTVLHTGL